MMEAIGSVISRVVPVRIVVDGFPVPAARPRFVRAGPFVRTYNPANVMQYRERLQAAAQEAMQGRNPLDGALRMSVLCVMPVPESMPKGKRRVALAGLIAHTKKPDCSNLLKNFEDALNGIVYIDDARLCEVTILKVYGEKPRVEIEIWPWVSPATQEAKLFKDV
jgi:Holliday junction resolvase RusA-like endonuclease